MTGTFLNISSTKFSLNGLEYHKVFIPVKVSDTHLKIVNVYDTKFVLLQATSFDDITVDGTGFVSLIEALNTLTSVVYSRVGIGGGTDINITSISGWADYTDSTYTSVSPFTISSDTKVNLPNDGVNGVRSEMPTDVSNFYDSATGKITGRNGDAYTLTLEFKVRPTSAASNVRIKTTIDIGGAVGEIYPRDFSLTKGSGNEHFYLSSFSYYTLDTFQANGGVIKIESVNSEVEIYDIRYVFTRTHKAGNPRTQNSSLTIEQLEGISSNLNLSAENPVASVSEVVKKGELFVNVKDYGAKGDTITLTDGNITSGNNVFTSASAIFSNSDIGKTVDTGGFQSIIASVTDSNTVVLVDNSTATVTNGVAYYGTDDLAAMQSAYDYIKSVGKGRLFHPKGEYYVSSKVIICDNIRIFGDHATILGPGNVLTNYNDGDGSADISLNDKNIEIDHLTFKSTINIFFEHRHLIRLGFVTNVKIHDNNFIGWQGDAVYLSGSAGIPGAVRHNKDVHIYDNYFNGINKDNRNGISFTDIDGAYVYDNVFENIARVDMPGAVDFEPNPTPADSVCTNVTVRNNTFRNIGGGVGTINVYLPLTQTEMVTPANNIRIYDNTLEDCYTGIRVSQDDAALTTATIPIDLEIRSNHIRNITRDILFLSGINGYIVEKNIFEDCASGIALGYLTDFTANGKLSKNILRRVATGQSSGLSIWSIQNLDLKDNLFEDCGLGTAGNGNAIQFRPSETSTRVHITGNTFTSPTGKTLVAIEGGGHTFDTDNNVDQRNEYNGLPNRFSAKLKDINVGKLTLDNDLETLALYKHSGLYNSVNSALEGITPKGGLTYDGGFNRQAAIKITLPVFKTGGLCSFDINIHNNGNNLVLKKISVSGFLSSSGWSKTYAVTLNGANFDYAIRFGDDGANSCIWIGETTSTWDQLLMSVSNIRVNNSLGDIWMDNWLIGLVTSFDTVQVTKTNNFPYADWTKIKGKPVTVNGTGASLALDNNLTGNTYNYVTPSNASVFSFVSPIVNGFARNFVQYTQAEIDALPNAAYPQVTGGAYRSSRSDTITADTLFEMVVESPDGTAVNYWFNIY